MTRTDFIDGLETTETQDALCECIQRWEDDGGQVVRECRINLHARKLSELAGMTRYEISSLFRKELPHDLATF